MPLRADHSAPRIGRGAILTVVFMVAAHPLLGAFLHPLGTSTNIVVCAGTSFFSCNETNFSENQSSGTPPLTLDATFDQPISGGFVAVHEFASSSFGWLQSSSSATISAHNSGVSVGVTSTASFTEQFTVNFGQLTGETGLLLPRITVNGRNSSTSEAGFDNVAGVSARPYYSDGTAGPFDGVGFFPPQGVFDGVYRLPDLISFTFAQPFELTWSISTDLNTDGTLTTSNAILSSVFDTVIVSGLQVFDSRMNPIPEATITSGSGTQYTQNGVVPEPPTSSLFLLTALLVIGALRIPCLRGSLRLPKID